MGRTKDRSDEEIMNEISKLEKKLKPLKRLMINRRRAVKEQERVKKHIEATRITCECCNKAVIKYSYQKHLKSNKHIKNAIEKNLV